MFDIMCCNNHAIVLSCSSILTQGAHGHSYTIIVSSPSVKHLLEDVLIVSWYRLKFILY